MEQFAVYTTVNGHDSRNYMKTNNISAYEEFIKYKPDPVVLGKLWFELLEDATRSLVLHSAKIHNCPDLSDNADSIIEATKRYARVYLISSDGDKALQILKGVISDLINHYDDSTIRTNEITEFVFNGIYRLIKI